MSRIGRKKIAGLRIGKKPVAVLFQGTVKIWEAARSCFGSGRWRGSLPWKGKDAWKGL